MTETVTSKAAEVRCDLPPLFAEFEHDAVARLRDLCAREGPAGEMPETACTTIAGVLWP